MNTILYYFFGLNGSLFSSALWGFNSLSTMNVLWLLWNNLSVNGFINYFQIRLCNGLTWLHIRHWIQEVSFVCHQCLLSLCPLCQISLYVSTLFPGRWPRSLSWAVSVAPVLSWDWEGLNIDAGQGTQGSEVALVRLIIILVWIAGSVWRPAAFFGLIFAGIWQWDCVKLSSVRALTVSMLA